jgi:hypothetical protein
VRVEGGRFDERSDTAEDGESVGVEGLTKKEDAAAVGALESKEEADGGRFTGAVGAEEAVDRSRGDGEGDSFEGGDGAIGFPNPLDL